MNIERGQKAPSWEKVQELAKKGEKVTFTTPGYAAAPRKSGKSNKSNAGR